MRIALCMIAVVSTLFFAFGAAQAQTVPPSPDAISRLPPVLMAMAPTAPQYSPDAQQRQRVEQQLQELQSLKQDMQRQVSDFDARFEALEADLGVVPTLGPALKAPFDAPALPATSEYLATGATDSKSSAESDSEKPFEPGKGIVAVRGSLGELSFGLFAYERYLNQLGLDPFYTDAFGRTFPVQQRQDLQLNRVQLNFRGWLFDEHYRYAFWAWTQNTNQGDDAQVVVGGTESYEFSDAMTLTGGIMSIPTTRSTSQTFPNWLKIDHRTIGDEFFRGSYTTAVQVNGEISPTVQYRAALANNLSQLGVSAVQLDNELNTIATALWWMPTTGEFGPGAGFGDYENHQELATLFGVHFTRSREDAQSQPKTNDFENTQIRLSDGTPIFGPDPFATGGNIRRATYQMLDLNAGFKLRGYSLEGEYYIRWVDNFDVVGTIPVTSLFDHGFQLQTSTMLVPEKLQTYVAGSKVFGQYGNPWDLGPGLTWFPFARKQVRVNFQALYTDRSPVGYSAVPFQVGGTGMNYTLDVGVWF